MNGVVVLREINDVKTVNRRKTRERDRLIIEVEKILGQRERKKREEIENKTKITSEDKRRCNRERELKSRKSD